MFVGWETEVVWLLNGPTQTFNVANTETLETGSSLTIQNKFDLVTYGVLTQIFTF